MKLRGKGRYALVGAVVAAAAVAAGMASARTATTDANKYVVHNLVSDVPGLADHTDPNLVNAWGLDAFSVGPWWVADNGTNLSTLYTADGTVQGLVVSVPGAPTGEVANASQSFVIKKGSKSGPAQFLFDGEDGTIRGWNSSVTGTTTVVAVDKSGEGAIFKGLAISTSAGRLYATDFHNNKVDVFDGTFTQVNNAGQFTDPALPKRFAPFGIQVIGTKVFVSYAKQDKLKEDEIAGPHLGYVDEYDTAGTLITRVATRGALNAPWGLAMAPDKFGRFSNDLLVGNFGDGWINAYTPQQDGTFKHHGALKGADGYALAIDGLWALEFGKGAGPNGPKTTLFFTAGPQDESHGLFGSIVAG